MNILQNEDQQPNPDTYVRELRLRMMTLHTCDLRGSGNLLNNDIGTYLRNLITISQMSF